MAHELKNFAHTDSADGRGNTGAAPEGSDRAFISDAVQIVATGVESLERRVRAFSEFSAEPAFRPETEHPGHPEERIAFLKSGHTEITYSIDRTGNLPQLSRPGSRKGNSHKPSKCGRRCRSRGRVLAWSYISSDKIHVEVHDSGSGLSEEALQTLFEPTISFKRNGTGLGLSIARKDALVCGGDLLLAAGKLGGAAFRLVLPVA
jgi:hypothetical protein